MLTQLKAMGWKDAWREFLGISAFWAVCIAWLIFVGA